MKVHAFLKTPLYRRASGRGKSLNANVLEIMGTAEVRDSGLDLSDLERKWKCTVLHGRAKPHWAL